MDIIIGIVVVYIAVILTIWYLDDRDEEKTGSFQAHPGFITSVPPAPVKVVEEVVEKKAAIVERPSAKRLRILKDKDKLEEHDAFMGILDSNDVLRASREAIDPSQKGYILKDDI